MRLSKTDDEISRTPERTRRAVGFTFGRTMKLTLSWLKDHLDTTASLAEIVDTLTRIGLEVEAVEDPGAKYKGFVIARVIEAAPHPNADRLRVCIVDAGGARVQVVCGAPNGRTGMRSVLSPVGT